MDFKAQGTTGVTTYRLKIKRDADNYIYDFGDGTFKNSGWGTIAGTLVEIDPTNLAGFFQLTVVTTAWNDGWYTLDYYSTAGTWGNVEEMYIESGKIAIPVVDVANTTTANTDMRGTDSAALASVCTEDRLGKLDATVSSRSSHSAADVASAILVTPANKIANNASGVIDASLVQIGGVVQSATDLKDFADTGYDPSSHKVQGVVLADTTTAVTNAVTVGTINTDVITAASIKTDAITEIQAGLALEASITTMQGNVTSILGDTNEMQGKLPTDYIMGSTVISAKDDEIDAIKAKTDNLPSDPADESIIVGRFDSVDSVIATILADTAELQGLISSSKIAAQVKGMDANTLTASALATDAATEIATAVLAKVIDGSIDMTKALKVILACVAGNITKSSNTYIFKDQSAATAVTAVVAETSVTKTVA